MGGFNFDPISFLGLMLGFVVGTTFHEFMHAYSALRLGDTTAQQQGRVTLNPAAHFDPLGFFMMLLLALRIGFIAWGKPVQVNPYALRFGKRGMSIVAVAGPLTNLALAIALSPLVKFGEGRIPDDVHSILIYMVYVNILLFAFNLIPVPPLDGFNILRGILPNYWNIVLDPVYRYGIPILLTLVLFVPIVGQTIGIPLNPLSEILGPVTSILGQLLLGT